MPLDVLGCTRATLEKSAGLTQGRNGRGNLLNLLRAWDRGLQLLPVNEEFLVSTSHQLVLIESLPFVHTVRRYYRLDGSVSPSDWSLGGSLTAPWLTEKTGKLGRLEEVKVVTRFP